MNSFYSNKSVLALPLAIFFSIIIYFNNDLKLIESSQRSWLYIKSVVTKPIVELQTFLSYKEDLMKLKLDRWVLDTRQRELEEYDFSFINFKNLLLTDSVNSHSFIVPKNQSLVSSKNIFYTANVLSNRSPQLSSSLFIDIGYDDFSADYEYKNMIVVDFNGNLVGRVINESISSNGSLVQLINDVNSRVIVDKRGVLNSTALLVPFNSSRFELIGSNNYKMKVGDTLFTSYKSDIYSKNIPVCKVVSVDKLDKNTGFKKINVEPLADFKNLEYVFVIESNFENSRVKY